MLFILLLYLSDNNSKINSCENFETCLIIILRIYPGRKQQSRMLNTCFNIARQTYVGFFVPVIP